MFTNRYAKILTSGMALMFALSLFQPMRSVAQSVSIPNPSFETGQDNPDGWTLERGEGEWVSTAADGARAIAVIGDGTDSAANFWVSETIDFKPNTAYQLQFQARFLEGHGGSTFTGPLFNNRSLTHLTDEWQRFTTNFTTPTHIEPDSARLRFGQWDIHGVLAFDDVRLVEAAPVFRQFDAVSLGAGEQILGAEYTFTAPFSEAPMNHARPLDSFDCYFNQPRWVFTEDDWVLYRHKIDGARQQAAELELNIGYYSGGGLEIEVGTNAEDWTTLGVLSGLGAKSFSLPEALFPADEILVRLRGRHADEEGQIADVGGSVQLHRYHYTATLEKDLGNLIGATHFVTVPTADDQLEVTLHDLGAGLPGVNHLHLTVENQGDETLEIAPVVTTTVNNSEALESLATPVQLAPNDAQEITLDYAIEDIGEVQWSLTLDERLQYRAETSFYLSPLHAQNFGALLPGTSEEALLWWASSGWKISRNRPAPTETSSAITIRAARNEREAAQVVLRPSMPLENLRVTVHDLRNAAGEVISASHIETLLVDYVPVAPPTDYLGVAGFWPDPLPPLNQPIQLAPDQNQPFWIRAYIPKETQAGVYSGVISFEAEDWQTEAPLEIEVFDFTLPDQMQCQSAFGFDGSLAQRYHGVETAEDRATLATLYKEKLSAHHISPYELGPKLLYPDLEYTWPNLPLWDGGRRIALEGATAGGAFYLEDDSTSLTVRATYEERFDVPAEGLHVSLRHRSDTSGHPFILVMMHYDEAGNWMHGRNAIVEVASNTSWQTFETVIEDFPEDAAQFIFEIQPARFAEDGSTTGRVWIDTIQLTDQGAQAHLIEDDFKPYTEEDIAELFRPEFDWASWDAAMEEILDTYHFNSFVIRTPGLGSGAGWAQYEPIPGSILGYPKGTPEYQAAFTAWYQEVQEHLREKGWLEKAFIYWFDEPEPDDYDFVMEYNALLKEVAPDLQRKLTEQIHPELVGGPNLWCPISFEYDHEAAEARRAVGERIWWYICTAPKAPYATLFIDHPGTELRVWLWQTWQRDIEGILIWHTIWWTSDAAYPDSLQNPYEDPMSWVHILGDIVPLGARHPWGNGDGRFLYPPKAAASGNPSSPVLEAPVGSIRLDMLRDGIEDYEYLALLEALIATHQDRLDEATLAAYRALLEVPETITSALDEFTWNPAPIEAHREAVARAIVALKGM